MQMSGFGRDEKEDLTDGDFIDYASRVPGAKRRGKRNPTSEEIEKATQDFVEKGGKIKKIIPGWDTSLEAFMNQPIGTMGADDFLMGVHA